MTLITIGFLAALAARSIFPGSDFFGSKGLLSQAMAGSATGGIIAVLMHEADQRFAFVPVDLLWSTLGATVVVAIVAVARRAHFARVLHGLEQHDD